MLRNGVGGNLGRCTERAKQDIARHRPGAIETWHYAPWIADWGAHAIASGGPACPPVLDWDPALSASGSSVPRG